MDAAGSISEKTQILINVYKNINDEGRDLLEKTVEKLGEYNGKQEKFKGIDGFRRPFLKLN